MSDYWKDNGLTKPQSVVVCAANRYGELIICGARHYDVIMRGVLAVLGGKNAVISTQEAQRCEEGFINQFGEFLTREEAFKVVQENGQPFDYENNSHGRDNILFSEGLY